MTKPFLAILFAGLVAAGSLSAQTILATDFENAEVKSYVNNEINTAR